jgi:ketosteroid isomerase-like protein
MRTLFAALLGAVGVLVGGLFFVTTLELSTASRRADAENRRYESFKLADSMRIEREHEAGSTVVHEATFVGTHTGNLRTPDGQVIAPTGRRLEVRYAFAFTVEGDLIQSVRGYFDQVDVLTQVGLMPEPAPGARVSG